MLQLKWNLGRVRPGPKPTSSRPLGEVLVQKGTDFAVVRVPNRGYYDMAAVRDQRTLLPFRKGAVP